MRLGKWGKLSFTLFLVYAFACIVPKISSAQDDGPIADYLANYFEMLNNYGDASLSLADRQLFREEILTRYFLFEGSLLWNHLRPKGSRYIKPREYLENMLLDFPGGISFAHKILEDGGLHSAENGLETLIRLELESKPSGQRTITEELIVVLAVQQYTTSSISARIKSIDKAAASIVNSQVNRAQEDVKSPVTIHKPMVSDGAFPDGLQGIENNMVRIPEGAFMMGCTADQAFDCAPNEEPLHQVQISSFRLSRYEVTQAQWTAVMGANPSFNRKPRNPVEKVSWEEVQKFIDKLNKLTNGNYRLPTEAEWEYAARGGGTLDVSSNSSNHRFSGSNNINEVAWYIEDSEGGTHPVGTKSPNALGLYDMTGNVWEWCSDWYSGDFYGNSPRLDPQGPPEGAYRVIRGGSWDLPADECQVYNRSYDRPNYRQNNLGFRLAAP